MIHISTILKHYKRKDIQEAIVDSSRDKEVGTRFAGGGFGKRPDVLSYPNDVLEFAKKGVSSFHISEEHWNDPLHLNPNLNPKEIEALRRGWDLVIDIDFPVWSVTKLIAASVIQALNEHDIKSISCKFSGNKGFHIGVPFEAFPKRVNIKGDVVETRLLFPESIKRIVEYIINYLDNQQNDFQLSRQIQEVAEFKEFLAGSEKTINDFTSRICEQCGTLSKSKQKEKRVEFVCPMCSKQEIKDYDTDYLQCSKCKILMDRYDITKKEKCSKCKNEKFRTKFNLEIDTLLISTRHLYRSVYSLHEKSGLVSVPVEPDKVMEFNRENAKPELVKVSDMIFLDSQNVKSDEAKNLIVSAFDFAPEIEIEEQKKEINFEEMTDYIPEELFPPCIKKILSGMDDGKKRGLFVLMNFLSMMNWSHDQIDARIRAWNKVNKEPLKETYLVGHLRYHKGKKMMPPNCDNNVYYRDLGMCWPDDFCSRIKNPVNYSVLKAKMIQAQQKNRGKGKKKTEKNVKEKKTEKKSETKTYSEKG